ncbi:hypothetical protein U1Q18_049103 [Sarracenia purpurea var. burkii]
MVAVEGTSPLECSNDTEEKYLGKSKMGSSTIVIDFKNVDVAKGDHSTEGIPSDSEEVVGEDSVHDKSGGAIEIGAGVENQNVNIKCESEGDVEETGSGMGEECDSEVDAANVEVVAEVKQWGREDSLGISEDASGKLFVPYLGLRFVARYVKGVG